MAETPQFNANLTSADLQEIAKQAALGIVRDPDLVRRVRERSAQVRERLLRERGIKDLAVDLIREGRDEE